MKLLDHIIDTMKEWELKLGRIDSDIRLYYPPDTICDYLQVDPSVPEKEILKKVEDYLRTEASFLGNVKVEAAKDHRIGVVIPAEGCDYVSDHIPMPDFLKELLQVLKKQDLAQIRSYFHAYAEKHGGNLLEDVEEEGMGTVLYFDKESIDPYVYCFDADDFGVTYHRFSRSDYDKLVQ